MTAKAISDTTLLAITESDFKELINRLPSWELRFYGLAVNLWQRPFRINRKCIIDELE